MYHGLCAYFNTDIDDVMGTTQGSNTQFEPIRHNLAIFYTSENVLNICHTSQASLLKRVHHTMQKASFATDCIPLLDAFGQESLSLEQHLRDYLDIFLLPYKGRGSPRAPIKAGYATYRESRRATQLAIAARHRSLTDHLSSTSEELKACMARGHCLPTTSIALLLRHFNDLAHIHSNVL